MSSSIRIILQRSWLLNVDKWVTLNVWSLSILVGVVYSSWSKWLSLFYEAVEAQFRIMGKCKDWHFLGHTKMCFLKVDYKSW